MYLHVGDVVTLAQSCIKYLIICDHKSSTGNLMFLFKFDQHYSMYIFYAPFDFDFIRFEIKVEVYFNVAIYHLSYIIVMASLCCFLCLP